MNDGRLDGPADRFEGLLAAYERGWHRLIPLVDAAAVSGPPVAACPGWDVVDVVRHLGGIAADVANGRVDDLAEPATSRSQIAARASLRAGAVYEEWHGACPGLVSACQDRALNARAFAPLPVVLLYDLATHEQDIRAALDAPRFSDEDAMHLCLGIAVDLLVHRLGRAGAPSLEIDGGTAGRWSTGDGEPVGGVGVEPFELWRSLSGRRTREQVRGYRWSADPGPFLDHWVDYPFSWPTAPVGD